MSENYNPNLPPTAQNPTLTPNFDQPSSQGQVTALLSPAQVLAANPQVAAHNATTVGGTAHTGDVLTLTLTNPVLPNGSLAVEYTVLDTDTLDSAAEALAAVLTSNFTAQMYGIFGTSYVGVTTVNQLGPVGNFTVVTGAVTGAGHEVTLTPASSGVMAGGSGPMIPLANANSQQGPVTLKLRAGEPVTLDPTVLADLVSTGLPLR